MVGRKTQKCTDNWIEIEYTNKRIGVFNAIQIKFSNNLSHQFELKMGYFVRMAISYAISHRQKLKIKSIAVELKLVGGQKALCRFSIVKFVLIIGTFIRNSKIVCRFGAIIITHNKIFNRPDDSRLSRRVVQQCVEIIESISDWFLLSIE